MTIYWYFNFYFNLPCFNECVQIFWFNIALDIKMDIEAGYYGSIKGCSYMYWDFSYCLYYYLLCFIIELFDKYPHYY